MVTSLTDDKHPYYEEISKMDGRVVNFFTGENSFRMKFVSLGEALDFVSFGGLNFVAYEMNTKELTGFIRVWMRNQESKNTYKRVPLGTKGAYRLELEKREFGYRWNNFKEERKVELPRVKHTSCPRDSSHKGTIRDLGGRIRCSDQDSEKFDFNDVCSYSSFDMLAKVERIYFVPSGEEDRNKKKEPDIREVVGTCYAIIEETPAVTLPLETVLDRINCSQNGTMHPFSGFTLANYARAWWEQPGRKRFFREKGEYGYYKEFKDFVPIGSDD